MKTSFSSHIPYHLLMLLSSFLVATSFLVGKLITADIAPLVLSFIRFGLASGILGLFLFIRGELTGSFSLFKRSALISLTIVIFFWSMFEALRHTTALNTSVIFALTPLFSALYSMMFGYEKFGKGRMLALLYGGFGALWVVFHGSISTFWEMSWNRGDLIFLGGCLVMGLYTPAIKKLSRGESSLLMTFWVLFSGSLWLFLFSLPQLISYPWQEIPQTAWAWLLYLVLFTTIITFYCNQKAVPKLGPVQVMAYSYLYPALVLALNLFTGQGLPDLILLPGIIIVVSAMFFIQRTEVDQN